ncbi:hypothetical protein TWF192_005170 [Orbilia oligospora]|uniref:Uncharacterized protein n=1 Tax=Orbilia oligospora TaxID=2813651 RepID=A0A6G1MBA4_ORBOL|nr:hypothetical protein TWF191_004517 [Orbilia oligospora]KAF3250730.1 hypothetical protein TWF192_005170 [Orbilia oligospora]
MRTSTACFQCRTAKRKCTRDQRNGPCKQCHQRQVSCSKAIVRQHSQQINVLNLPSPAEAVVEAVRHPYSTEVLDLVDLYFDYIHDKPHILFHEPTLKTSVRNGSVSRTVLLSLIAISARFSDNPAVRALGPAYAQGSKACFKADLENVCIENTQAAIVIANICLAEGDSRAESLYYALAIRMAQMLDLASGNEDDDGITREVKRRVWWTCFIVDIWSSGGGSLARQLQVGEHQPRLPLEEIAFLELRPGERDFNDTAWKTGIWSHMVRMIELYKEIQDLLRYLVATTQWDEDFIENTVHGLAVRLLAFEERLGPELTFSAENVARHARRGTGRLFTGFHLGYQYYCMVLFYQYLDKSRPSTRNGAAYADRCKLHARRFCDILRTARQSPKAEALHNINAHITIVSSSVLLHNYMFGDASELADTQARLESNLEFMVKLRRYWPSVELVINRLNVFLRSCVRSTSKNTHRFDKWMVKFLQEYSMTLAEKEEEGPRSPQGQMDAFEYGFSERNLIMQGVISTYGSDRTVNYGY